MFRSFASEGGKKRKMCKLPETDDTSLYSEKKKLMEKEQGE